MIRSLKTLSAAACFLLSGTFTATSLAAGTDLVIKLQGVHNAQGNVIGAVFTDARSFESNNLKGAFAAFQVRARLKPTQITLHDLPKGPYAIFLFHDENSNDDLDVSFGKPKEGFAFSNNAGRQDNPNFQNAKIILRKQKSQTVSIRMIYLK